MKKKLLTLLLAGGLALSSVITSFAGQWKQDTTGWWYENDDASYLKDGWNWVDGKCYYFTPEGYCLINTTTPDGYSVDTSGAWIVDGVVQTQQPISQGEIVFDTLTFTPPEGFVLDSSENDQNNYLSFTYLGSSDSFEYSNFTIFSNSFAASNWNEKDIAYATKYQYSYFYNRFENTFDSVILSSRKYDSGIWQSGLITSFEPNLFMAHVWARVKNGHEQIILFSGDGDGSMDAMDAMESMINNIK